MDRVEWVERDEINRGAPGQLGCEVAQVTQITRTPVSLAAQGRQKAVDAIGGAFESGEVALVRGKNPADALLSLACL